jgi:hypothetical protein
MILNIAVKYWVINYQMGKKLPLLDNRKLIVKKKKVSNIPPINDEDLEKF